MRYGFFDEQVGQINGEFGKWTVEADMAVQSRTMRIYEGITTYQDYIPIYPIQRWSSIILTPWTTQWRGETHR